LGENLFPGCFLDQPVVIINLVLSSPTNEPSALSCCWNNFREKFYDQ